MEFPTTNLYELRVGSSLTTGLYPIRERNPWASASSPPPALHGMVRAFCFFIPVSKQSASSCGWDVSLDHVGVFFFLGLNPTSPSPPGLTDADENCKRFMDRCMPEAFKKVSGEEMKRLPAGLIGTH